MRNWPSAAARWVRHLFEKEEESTPRFPGSKGLSSGTHAIVATESLISEHLFHVSGHPGAIAGSTLFTAFDRPVNEVWKKHTGEAMGVAGGLAIGGSRVATFLPADALTDAHRALSAAAARFSPMVVHVLCQSSRGSNGGVGAGHGGVYAVADSGFFVLFARTVQEAVDLSLVARRVTELTLVPGLLAIDGAETGHAVQNVALPSADLIVKYLGEANDLIECPTPAQLALFGPARRRVPAWFDTDRPMASGLSVHGNEYAAAAAGRSIFFGSHVGEFIESSMAELAKLTGRSLRGLSLVLVENAEHVIVAQGAAIEVALAAAAQLRMEGGRVGVAGITTTRPFPAAALRNALGQTAKISVVERALTPGDDEGPLSAQVRNALHGVDTPLRCVTGGPAGQALSAAALHGALSAEGIASAFAGIRPPSSHPTYPKREVFLQPIKAAYDLASRLPVPSSNMASPPTVLVAAWRQAVSDVTMSGLATAWSDACGPFVRSTSWLATEGAWIGRVTASKETFDDIGVGGVADVLVLGALDLPTSLPLFDGLREACPVILVLGADPGNDLWERLPFVWQESVRRLNLKLYTTHLGLNEAVRHVASFREGSAEGFDSFDWSKLSQKKAPSAPTLPQVVTRFDSGSGSVDDIARYWTEVVNPRQAGAVLSGEIDPWLSLGVAPPDSAAMFTSSTPRLPLINATACTGCGKCWSSCPDTALGATALTVNRLLEDAESRAFASKERSAAGDKLKRALKQLASRLNSTLSASHAATLDATTLNEAFEWLITKMNITSNERGDYESAFGSTRDELLKLDFSLTEPLFFKPQSLTKGSGELLALTVNPSACKGCEVCAKVCTDNAIEMVEWSSERHVAAASEWAVWESLPDTLGSSIERLLDSKDLDPLAAVLLTKHCSMSLVGADAAEPGSGQRLAARLTTAVAEFSMQKQVLGQIEALDMLGPKLRAAVRDRLANSIDSKDLALMEAALGGAHGLATKAADVAKKLDELGARTQVDSGSLKRLVAAARDIEALSGTLSTGVNGLGRARLGIVLAGESLSEWASTFPKNPFSVPVVADLAGDGSALAEGVVEGLLGTLMDGAKLARMAELLLANPSDLLAKENALAALTWRDLDADERGRCPRLVLFVDDSALEGEGLAGLLRLLSGSAPVKVICLDGLSAVTRTNLVNLALGTRSTFVASTALSEPAHFFESVRSALGFDGPAFVHVHCPSPSRHGFETGLLIEQARLAVACRVQPLLTYDPAKGGVFGTRLSLAGNPQPEALWVVEEGRTLRPGEWTASEERFAGSAPTSFVAEREANWLTLRELAGVETPFTNDVRKSLQAELIAGHATEIAALKQKHMAELTALEQSKTAEQATRLRNRLLQLAGYGLPAKEGEGQPS